jgi:hypothetical protein
VAEAYGDEFLRELERRYGVASETQRERAAET